MEHTRARYTAYTCSKNSSVRGLGRRLFLAVTKRLLDDGMSSMLLWVFEANLGARQFYESLGGENTSRSAVIKIAGSDLVEIAYGWTDIAPLVR